MKNNLHEGPVIDSKEGVDIIECSSCGFKHITPLPSDKELEELYEEEYYSTDKPKYIEEAKEDLKWWELTYKEYYKLFDQYCSSDSKTLLEIGSGPGFFLKYGQKLGWDVTGVEPSKQAYEYSTELGIRVINDFYTTEIADTIGKFDVIFMDTVLEHLPDPISMLELLKKNLKKDGLMCVISPNDYNPLQNILREHLNAPPWWVVPHHHLNYFDFDSIKTLLEKLDFQVVKMTSTFPMEFFLLCGDNYIGNAELGRECHLKRKTFEENMFKWGNESINSLYDTFAEMGIGRKFVAIAKHTH